MYIIHPSREDELTLYEMYEVSGLVMGNIPYEEYVPLAEELHLMEDSAPLVYVTNSEVLCHFHICTEITGLRSGGVRQMSWAAYLFNGLGDKADRITRLAPSTDAEIKERISASMPSYTTESVEDTFRPGTVFESFHYQAKTPISNRALLARFLMLWLKWCEVPTFPHEVIVANVVYPTLLLAFGRGISLLPMMVGCIQSGLWALTKTFCKKEALVDTNGNALTDQHGNPQFKVPNPRIKLAYTYLVAWYIIHCLSLMTAAYRSEDFVPFLQKLEHSTWQHIYIFYIRRPIQNDLNYQLVRCLPDIQDTLYGDRFLDM